MSKIKFKAKIRTQKRIQIPSRLENFQIGDEVLVTIEKFPKPKKVSDMPANKEKASITL